jgi:thiosulfate/3-mercaptopyruvate sulfurtransferase
MSKSFALAFALVVGGLSSGAAIAQRPDTSLVVTTEWLARHIDDPAVVVLAVEHDYDSYKQGHVPGARYLDYNSLTARVNGISMEMPPADSLAHLFGSLGVTPSSHVVLYAHMMPMATRALVTLEYAGVRKVSLLDGGVTRWMSEHRQLTDAAPKFVATRFAPNPNREMIASADWVRDKLSKPGVSLIDTRTDPEYNGGGERHGGTSTGHLPGARQLQWEQLTAPDNELQLKDLSELRRLYAERVTPGDTVVTYCAIGYRASVTYFVARYLGYPAKLFDGSYDEWSKLGYPTETARTPLRRP